MANVWINYRVCTGQNDGVVLLRERSTFLEVYDGLTQEDSVSALKRSMSAPGMLGTNLQDSTDVVEPESGLLAHPSPKAGCATLFPSDECIPFLPSQPLTRSSSPADTCSTTAPSDDGSHSGVAVGISFSSSGLESPEDGMLGLRPRKTKLRPCKGKRDRYRKLVSRLVEQFKKDPTKFDVDSISLPPSVAHNRKLVWKLNRRVLDLLGKNEEESRQCPSSVDGGQDQDSVVPNVSSSNESHDGLTVKQPVSKPPSLRNIGLVSTCDAAGKGNANSNMVSREISLAQYLGGAVNSESSDEPMEAEELDRNIIREEGMTLPDSHKSYMATMPTRAAAWINYIVTGSAKDASPSISRTVQDVANRSEAVLTDDELGFAEIQRPFAENTTRMEAHEPVSAMCISQPQSSGPPGVWDRRPVPPQKKAHFTKAPVLIPGNSYVTVIGV